MIKYYCDICGQEITFNKQIEKIDDYNYHGCEGEMGHACKECKEEEQKIRNEEYDKANKNAGRRVKEFVKNKLDQNKKRWG